MPEAGVRGDILKDSPDESGEHGTHFAIGDGVKHDE